MTKPIAPPQSWRDLTRAELIALLEEAAVYQMMLRPRDLVWAQWKVASAALLAAHAPEQQAYTTEFAAFDAWRQKKNGKSLSAWEAAQAKTKRVTATLERLRRRADALYSLHKQLCEAERS